jgi:protocatechuate 3,4-dioxygenase beta subunit
MSGAASRGAASRSAQRGPTERGAFDVVVRDETGAPVAGARVAADALAPPDDPSESGSAMPAKDGAPPAASATTGADGRASLGGLGTGRWRIAADAAGFVKCAVESVWVDGDPPREVVVALERPCSLAVRVRDAAGAAAGGVAVRVSEHEKGPWPREWTATTSAQGTCRVDGLPRGTLMVRCADAKKDDRLFVQVPEVARVDLTAPPAAAEAAREMATLEVRVAGPDGVPIRGADVVFEQDFGDEQTARGTSGDDGICRATAIADALACVDRIVVRHDGHVTARRKMMWLVQVGAGRSHRFDDVVLEREAQLEGRVIGPEGPVPNANVTVWVAGTGPFGEMEEERTTTDADGRYRMGGLPAGTVVVAADAPGLDPVDADRYGNVAGSFGPRTNSLDEVPASAKVELAAGQVTAFDVRMKRTGPAQGVRATLSGVVRRGDGTPAPYADVWAAGATDHHWVYDAGRTISAADGTFRLTAEAGEGFHLYGSAWGLWKDDGLEVPMTASGEKSGIELVLDARPVVRGIVRSALGRPVAGGRVLVGTHHSHKFNEATHWNEQPEGVVAADGSYAVPVETGPFGGSDHDMRMEEMVVLVDVEGHGPAISAPLTPADLAAGKTFDFTLDAGAAIAGRVIDGAGAPVADAPVTLVTARDWNIENWPPRHPPRYEETLAARTAADGSFEIRHLFAGKYTIAVTVPGCVTEAVDATAPAKDVVVRARASLAVAGVVLGPDEAATPLARAVLHLLPVGGGTEDGASAGTDEDGSFRFDGVPAGPWKLVVVPDADGADAQPTTIDVVAGSTDLRIRTKPGLTIAGTLLDADGKPVAGAEAYVDRDDRGEESWAKVVTDESGRFVFKNRAPGRHGVRFSGLGLGFEGIDAPSSPTLRVPGKLTITGKVRDRAAGRTPGVGVSARRVDAPPGTPIDVHDADVEGGVFTISGLAAGHYEISVSGSVADPRHSWEWRLKDRTVLAAGAAGAVLTLDLVEVTRSRDDR